MATPQTVRTAFRHADVVELAFPDELGERADAFLDGGVAGYTGRFEKVEFLGAAELCEDIIHAALQKLRPAEKVVSWTH